MKRIASFILGATVLSLTGCAVVSKEVERPAVAVRYESTKTAKVFAECAAAGLERQVSRKGESYAIEMQDGIRMRARWDFFPTLDGSQAELRGSPDFDAGIEIVRACS
jgi:hypothetical protein